MNAVATAWISLDQEKCNACGLCVERCRMNYHEKDGVVTVNAGELTCNLCGHCVSLCPTGAIDHHQMEMDNFLTLDRKLNFDPKEFVEFVRGRRSIRHYKDKPVPQEDIEALVEMCRYTPTGSNRQTLEMLVIQDPERIGKLANLTVDCFKETIEEAEKTVADLNAAGKEVPPDVQAQHDMVVMRKGLVMARDLGWDPIFHKAPAVLIFHSIANTSTPKDDCVIAAQTVVLAAMTMKMGTCYIGLFDWAARSYAPIIEDLALPSDNRIGSILTLGYPKLTFLKTVDRVPMKVRWE